MIHPDSNPLCLGETRAVVAAPSAAVRAYLALVAGLGGVTTAVMLMMSVAANTQDDSYAATLVAALTVNLSKPLR
jgi:hypothetical protein